MRIELTKRFLSAARKRSAEERLAIDQALTALLENFGHPHRHVGRSARRLRPSLFELRASLELRIIFSRDGSVLRADFVGDHDEVANYLKNSR